MKQLVKRILLVDDNESIHEDVKNLLAPPAKKNVEISSLEDDLFGGSTPEVSTELSFEYELHDAFQGEEALTMVETAMEKNEPYALIFMDVRMPPGMDGITTIQKIWQKYPEIEMVICTAYSDYSWEQITKMFGQNDHLLFLKKPFDAVAIKQIALTLSTKWELNRRNNEHIKMLASAKEKAVKASRAKTEFLANMSHEMRTPINGILGFAEILASKSLKEEESKFVSQIINESERLLKLINQLLDISKIEAGQLDLEPQEFSLFDILNDIKQFVSPRTESKGLKYVERISVPLPKVLIGDSLRLYQVLLVLVENSIKFTDKGSIHVSVNKMKQEEKTIFLRFEVTDSGMGIPEPLKQTIFDRFKQGEEGTTRRFGGTGLGTTIAKSIVTKMGGEIGVESVPGTRTTFWFEIPLDIADDTDVTRHKEGGQETPDSFFKNRKILVVEDYEPNREIILQHLSATGCGAEEAENGAIALEHCKEKRYDVILMDCRMPVMDGYDATRAIRNLAGYQSVPIIGVTANAYPEDIAACIEAGMSEVLTKPIRRKKFLSKLEECLAKLAPTSPSQLIETELNDEEKTPPGKIVSQQDKDDQQESVVDFDALVEEMEDKEIAYQILKGFSDGLENQIINIETSIQSGDWEVVNREAHSIKGGAANVMAEPLREVAFALEKASEPDEPNDVTEQLNAVKRAAQMLAGVVNKIE